MLKRPKARDIMADVFPENTNDWTPCLKLWEPVSAAHPEARILTLGSMCANVALWFAFRGHQVWTPAQSEDIYEEYDVAGQIAYPDPDVSADIVCVCDNSGRTAWLESELQNFHEQIRLSKAVLIAAPQRYSITQQLAESLRKDGSFFLEQELTYGVLRSGSRSRYVRHAKVMINETLGRMMPGKLRKMKFQVLKTRGNG